MSKRIRVRNLSRSIAGFVVAILFVLPMYWAIIASLEPAGVPPNATITWWPSSPQWENYSLIFELVPLANYAANSLYVVFFAVPLTLLTASLGGFAIAQLGRAAREYLINLSIGMLLIPGAGVWLFRFQLLSWMDLLDSPWALILPAFAASSPIFVLLFYWSYRRIPEEVVDAALLDGAEAWTIWYRIALPLSIPTVVGVSVLTFVMYWSDFVSPVLYLFTPKNYTLPIGLQLLNQVGSTNWPLLMAGAVFMTVPVLIFFIAFQRFFLSDLSMAGLFDRN